MTYAKIRYVRNLTEELYHLEKLQEKFFQNASATKTGGKNAVKRENITKMIKELKLERKALVSEINAWFDSLNLSSHDREIFSDYFFKAKEKDIVEKLYRTKNIHHDLKKHLYNF